MQEVSPILAALDFRGTFLSMAVGRPPEIGEARSEFLRVRLAPSEILQIDKARGAQSRSDFVRDAVTSRTKRGAK